MWDREIILTAAKDYYAKDINLLEEDIEGNFTDVRVKSLKLVRTFHLDIRTKS